MFSTPYTEKDFKLPSMDGLSDKQISEHLKLYAGYVKNGNALAEEVKALGADPEKNARTISELTRRLAFEWNGMRMHEYYFEALGGKGPVGSDTPLIAALGTQHGSFEDWLASFKRVGAMRGIGWVVLSLDRRNGNLITSWVSDHELGHLAGTTVILAMDVWEHAYLIDYLPSGRKDYIEAFFKNLDWNVAEKRFMVATQLIGEDA